MSGRRTYGMVVTRHTDATGNGWVTSYIPVTHDNNKRVSLIHRDVRSGRSGHAAFVRRLF